MKRTHQAGVKWLVATLAGLAMTGIAGGTLALAQDSSNSPSETAAPAGQQYAPDHQWGEQGGQGHGGWDRGADHGGWGHRCRHHGGRHHRKMMGPGMMMDMGLLRSFHQLNLTADQRQQVHSILSASREQSRPKPSPQMAQNFAALMNPGDPNYASAVQAAKQRAGERIQHASELQQKLYNVLTPEQKAQLTQLIQHKMAKLQQRFGAEHRPHHGQRPDQQQNQTQPQPQEAQPQEAPQQ